MLGEFLKLGFRVSIPYGEHSRYDLVVDTGYQLLRVQCKTGRLIRNGAVLCFDTCSRDGHRPREGYKGQADVFAVYSPHTGQVYIMDVDAVPETAVWLRIASTGGHNNQHGIRRAEDYLLEKWAARQATTAISTSV